MGTLGRVVSYSFANNADKRNVLRKLLITRLLSVYGVSAVLLLVKLRKLASHSQRVVALQEIVRNSSAVAITATLVPVFRALTGVKNAAVPWSAAVGAGLVTATELPTFLPSYVAVESLSDAVTSTSFAKTVLSHMSVSTLVTARQALLCLLIPLFYNRANKQSSAAARFLFNRRSLVRDFLSFYIIWNFLSLYNSLKSFLMNKRSERTYTSQQHLSGQVDDWPMISGNLKPLMDKLGEIHEITLQDSYSVFEKFMNSAIINNVMPCFKWALWRQLCVRTMNHKLPTRNGHNVGAALMNSFTLMLGFFVLDQNDNKMNIRPGVLRYLVRCCLTTYLKDTSLNFQRLITFLGSQLALQNVAQQSNYSK